MPPVKQVAMEFLLHVVKGDKKLMTQKDVVPYHMPKLDEFKLEAGLQMCAEEETLRKFIPADWFAT